MKNLKYILTKESIQFRGSTLYRIKALKDFGDVKAGDLGGYIEKELNLSQEGKCWVHSEAKVCHYAWVCDNARVRDYAVVSGYAWVCDYAVVGDYAVVLGNSVISYYAVVCGNAWVSGNAVVRDNAIATKKVITFRNIYTLTMTDNHIRYGCIQKTIEEWKLFLDSNEVIETKRDTDKFKAIESTLREVISIWENDKDF